MHAKHRISNWPAWSSIRNPVRVPAKTRPENSRSHFDHITVMSVWDEVSRGSRRVAKSGDWIFLFLWQVEVEVEVEVEVVHVFGFRVSPRRHDSTKTRPLHSKFGSRCKVPIRKLRLQFDHIRDVSLRWRGESRPRRVEKSGDWIFPVFLTSWSWSWTSIQQLKLNFNSIKVEVELEVQLQVEVEVEV